MDTMKHLAARTGYHVYLDSGRQMDRDGINRELAHRGLPDIAERTFRHYRSMAEKRQIDYIPINEFDIAVKSGYFDKAS